MLLFYVECSTYEVAANLFSVFFSVNFTAFYFWIVMGLFLDI